MAKKQHTPATAEQHAPAPVAPLSDPDVVDRIFEYIVEQFPEIGAARVAEMKQATREEFRGAEYYIASRSPTERQRLVEEALRLFNGRNATEVARRLHLSRATVYRWVKQPGPAQR